MKVRNNIKTLSRKAIAAAVTASLLIGSAAQAEQSSADGTPAYDAPVSMTLNFAFHTEMDMAEQDAFIEREPGSGEIGHPGRGILADRHTSSTRQSSPPEQRCLCSTARRPDFQWY